MPSVWTDSGNRLVDEGARAQRRPAVGHGKGRGVTKPALRRGRRRHKGR